MKILNFDNTRVSEFINPLVPQIREMFWQEYAWLCAYFWYQAYTKSVQMELDKDPKKYIDNFKEPFKLAEEKRYEVDALYEQMVGMMKTYLKKKD